MHAIEVAGRINQDGYLELNSHLNLKDKKVKVIILFDEEGIEDDSEWLKAAASNPAFDFLKQPAEDIYTLNDGEPYRDEE